MSSSAHLLLAARLRAARGTPGAPAPAAGQRALASALHAGSAAGVAVALAARPWPAGGAARRRLALVLLAAPLPAVLAGVLAADAVDRRLGRPAQVAALLGGVGLLLGAVDRLAPQRRGLAAVGVRDAVAVGLAQPLALAPGASRAAVALVAARAAGLDRGAAARVCHVAGLPLSVGSAVFSLATADPVTRRALQSGLGPLLLGALAAAVTTGVVLSAYLSAAERGRGSTAEAAYRVVLALVLLRLPAARGER